MKTEKTEKPVRSRADEAREMLAEAAARNVTLTARGMVDAARNKRKWPKLNEHLWDQDTETMLMEARVARANRIIMGLKFTVSPGVTTRSAIHVGSTPGYYSHEVVEAEPDLTDVHMDRMRDDIKRAIMRYHGCATFLDPERREPLGEGLRAAWYATFKPGTARPFPGDKEPLRATA